MAKVNPLTDSEQVTAHIQKLDVNLAIVAEFIRQTIMNADGEIAEQIKWNSPSFYYTGEMKPFDPKEYKRDIVVMNLHRGMLLVFPTGVRIDDATGILEGNYPDGRKILKIKSLSDAESKKDALILILKDWLAKVDK